MAENLSTTEIEDVLSSIRRLVAEDLRPHVPVHAAVVETARHKLILTPALRVVTSNSDEVPATDIAGVVSSLGSGLPQSEWEPEAEETILDGQMFGDAAQDLADHGWAIEQDENGGRDDEIVFLPSDFPDIVEPEMDHEPHFDDSIVAEPTFVSIRRRSAVDDVPSWAQSDDLGEPEAEIAQYEIVAGTIEPDPKWADAAEADVLAELGFAGSEQNIPAIDAPEFELGDSDFDEAADFVADEPLYDEALLRDIVRDLLREELQGAMGERITRNIRKLVRAEIARALATQDLT